MTPFRADLGSARLTGPGYCVEIDGDGTRVRFEVDLSGAGFAATRADLDAIEPLDTAVGLLPAMATGRPLQLERRCAAEERTSLESLQARFCAWTEDSLQHVPILDGARTAEPKRRPGRRVASFFSGGVDSWYTLLKRQQEIDLPVMVHGFDVPLSRPELWARRQQVLANALRSIGKPYVVVRTNLREFSDPLVAWPWYHGAALAAVARVLTPFADRSYVASSFSLEHLIPWGSHPATDWLWGTPGLRIEHDGCEANRLEKVARIAESPAALGSLRVCWQNIDSPYNCSVCRKCVMTQLALAAVGALDRATTFDSSHLAELVPGMDSDDPVARRFLTEILEYQLRTGQDTPYRRLLEGRLSRRAGPWGKLTAAFSPRRFVTACRYRPEGGVAWAFRLFGRRAAGLFGSRRGRGAGRRQDSMADL